MQLRERFGGMAHHRSCNRLGETNLASPIRQSFQLAAYLRTRLPELDTRMTVLRSLGTTQGCKPGRPSSLLLCELFVGGIRQGAIIDKACKSLVCPLQSEISVLEAAQSDAHYKVVYRCMRLQRGAWSGRWGSAKIIT